MKVIVARLYFDGNEFRMGYKTFDAIAETETTIKVKGGRKDLYLLDNNTTIRKEKVNKVQFTWRYEAHFIDVTKTDDVSELKFIARSAYRILKSAMMEEIRRQNAGLKSIYKKIEQISV